MTEEIKNEEVKTEETKEENAPVEEVKEETATVEEVKTEEAPKEDTKEEAPKKAEPTGKFKDLITSIESLTALELADLVKELEERFGVSASAPVAMVGGVAPAAGAADVAEEKTSFTVVLAAAGDQKINVIKAVREINPELGLKEAKDIVDEAPKEIKQNIKKEEAEEAKAKLEAAGATVELK